nr:hypothetical protein [Tanacetum cinerariifolium]
MIRECKAYDRRPAHKALYGALAVSLSVDSDDMDKQLEDPPAQKKKRRDDQDQDPPGDSEKKRKRKDADTSSSKKDTGSLDSRVIRLEMTVSAMSRFNLPEAIDKSVKAHLKNILPKDLPDYDSEKKRKRKDADTSSSKKDRSTWFKQDVLVRPETPDLEWHKEPNDFPEQSWFNGMDKIIKVDLEGPTFKLLKGKYKNYIELEYNFEECYRALTDQIDLIDPEGERTPYDLCKPLPLQGQRQYASSLTKPKATWARNNQVSCQKVYSQMKILSIIRLSIDKQFGYGYLKEIIVRRANQKECVFNEADFKRLHMYDIEEMYLLYAQNKLHHLKGHEHTNLVTTL